MRTSRSNSISASLIVYSIALFWGAMVYHVSLPPVVLGRIYIDINAPTIQKMKIAIPDFHDLSDGRENAGLSGALPVVLSNDLDLSGYFTPMEKGAFLGGNNASAYSDNLRLRDWSVIGADFLLLGRYSCIGRSIEVEARLFDIFRGRQILGKRFLGKTGEYRDLMHRLSNEIIYALTGQQGMFLSKIAFTGTATGHKEIYLCDIDGENIKRITSDESIALFPRWCPQGDRLLFNSYMEGGAMLYHKDMRNGKVKRISARKGLNIGASWAPDGKSAALTLSHGSNPDIFRIDLEGKVLEKITDHWGIDVSPSFSPDGKKIAFVSNRSGNPQIYVHHLLTGKAERITFDPDLKYNTSPTWSSGNRIAFSGMNQGHFDIFSIDPDGSKLRQLTSNQGNNEDPCWSPDGRYILFSSNRTGRYHLYIMNANGLNQRRITSLNGNQTAPSWSPF